MINVIIFDKSPSYLCYQCYKLFGVINSKINNKNEIPNKHPYRHLCIVLLFL
jgi:hypothetical protein